MGPTNKQRSTVVVSKIDALVIAILKLFENFIDPVGKM